MIKQYGVIPFLREGKDLKVVLVTSANGYWIFPKGNLEDDLGKVKTASLEGYEEAGVKGRILERNSYRARIVLKSGDKASLKLYPLEVQTILDKWPEACRRKRRIVDIDEALKLIDSKALQKCLNCFVRDLVH